MGSACWLSRLTVCICSCRCQRVCPYPANVLPCCGRRQDGNLQVVAVLLFAGLFMGHCTTASARLHCVPVMMTKPAARNFQSVSETWSPSSWPNTMRCACSMADMSVGV